MIINNGKNLNMGSEFNTSNSNMPRSHIILKRLYSDFVLQVEKSDVCNSPRRYVSELEYVENLLRSSKTHNLASEIELFEQKKNQILQKLKEFGVTVRE